MLSSSYHAINVNMRLIEILDNINNNEKKNILGIKCTLQFNSEAIYYLHLFLVSHKKNKFI